MNTDMYTRRQLYTQTGTHTDWYTHTDRYTHGQVHTERYPRAKLDLPLCKYTGVTRKVPFKLRPQDRKGAPLCRYTGVTRKVPFKLRPKDSKKGVQWVLKKCRAPRGNKNRGNRGIKFETETDCV